MKSSSHQKRVQASHGSDEAVLRSLENIRERVAALQVMVHDHESSALILRETAGVSEALTRIHRQLVRLYLQQALTERGGGRANEAELDQLITEIAKTVY
jgi:DNA-binding FrmR family transcriptional regulator